MIADKETKILVGETPISGVYQGDTEIWTSIPYTKLNYIESAGKQQITLKHKPTANTRITMDLMLTSSRPSQYEYNIFTSNWDFAGFAMIEVGGTFRWHNGLWSNTNYTTQINRRILMDVYQGTVVIDGREVLNITTSAGCNQPIKLFYYNALHPAFYRLYSFKIYENNILIYDLIPVLDKNGIPCLYDKIEKQLYYNTGTGQFLYG